MVLKKTKVKNSIVLRDKNGKFKKWLDEVTPEIDLNMDGRKK